MSRGNDQGLFLFNLFNDGSFRIFAWTAIQAAKGFTVMTKEKAQPYVKLAQMGKAHIDHVRDKAFIKSIKKITEVSGKAGQKLEEKRIAELAALDEDELYDADDSNTKDIVSNVTKDNNKIHRVNDDDVRELSVTQEAIQIKECKYIRKLQHKSTLESHMLEKYQCEIPSGRLDAMKAIANSMISDLAKDNRLYLVDNQVK